jgi:hypothetical protein
MRHSDTTWTGDATVGRVQLLTIEFDVGDACAHNGIYSRSRHVVHDVVQYSGFAPWSI